MQGMIGQVGCGPGSRRPPRWRRHLGRPRSNLGALIFFVRSGGFL